MKHGSSETHERGFQAMLGNRLQRTSIASARNGRL